MSPFALPAVVFLRPAGRPLSTLASPQNGLCSPGAVESEASEPHAPSAQCGQHGAGESASLSPPPTNRGAPGPGHGHLSEPQSLHLSNGYTLTLLLLLGERQWQTRSETSHVSTLVRSQSTKESRHHHGCVTRVDHPAQSLDPASSLH